MNMMVVVVALLIIKHDGGYLQLVCNAILLLLIFHTVKTFIYYAEKNITKQIISA